MNLPLYSGLRKCSPALEKKDVNPDLMGTVRVQS